MTYEELITFVKRKARYTRKTNRQPWVEILEVLEKENKIEHSLAKQLKSKGISQSELAGQLGVARCTVSIYLNGRRTPPKWFTEKITEILK